MNHSENNSNTAISPLKCIMARDELTINEWANASLKATEGERRENGGEDINEGGPFQQCAKLRT
jgi:hypothetical protein